LIVNLDSCLLPGERVVGRVRSHGQDHEFDYVPAYRAAVAQDIAFFLRRMVTDRESIEADVAANSIFAAPARR
jgi:hypothetical protein